MRFGVNYTPSKRWWYSWLDWESSSIEEDLAAISSLGLDHIRIYLLWSVFQPNPDYISEKSLDRLEELLDLAHKFGLGVEVTVLNGWLSGFNFSPVWQNASWRGNSFNIFTHLEVIKAEKLLFNALAERIGKHCALMGFDLGNELGVLQNKPYTNQVTPAQADKWLREMLAYCEELVPGKLHVNGVDHQHWFSNKGFSRTELANTGAITAIHTWPYFTGAFERYGTHGVGSLHLAEYNIELVKAYQHSFDRQVWVQEFGVSTQWMPQNKIEDFVRAFIFNASTCTNVWGYSWWCSHDINPAFGGFDKLEYDLGLFDYQNKIKPIGLQLAKLIKELHQNPPSTLIRPVALVLPDSLFDTNKKSNWKLARSFMRLVSEGVKPSIVLLSRIEEKDYLKLRDISLLVEL